MSTLNNLELADTSNRRATNRRNNKQAILDAARQVFSERGYGATTVRDIIRRTNLATGTFYNYFDSKEAVFDALNAAMGSDLRLALSNARAAADDFASFVESNFRIYFTYYANHKENYFLTRSNRGRDGVNQMIQGPQVQAGLADLHADIRRAIEAGVLPALDVDYITAAFGGIAFSVLDIMMERTPLDPEGATQFATKLVMVGIKPHDL